MKILFCIRNFLIYLPNTVLIFSCDLKENNLRIERYDDNNVKFLKRYSNEVLHGESVWFFQNGNVEQKVIFRNGRENGHAHYFYPSGALKSHRFWHDGKMIGFCADYWDDSVGIIQSSLLFNKKGELVYKKSFDRTGRVISVEGTK
jgi:antitoxin component YwqK of YwqJK toxin-antitoxin module